jgi:hypothetical protein
MSRAFSTTDAKPITRGTMVAELDTGRRAARSFG